MRDRKSYRVQEFAELAGVTVRALHHYDRLGLLRPRRAASGYRLYALRDLERLEQIVALKFLGIPLRQVGALLDREGLGLAEVLRRQRAALEAKRRLLDRAIRALRDAENSAHGRQRPPAGLLKKIIEVIEMQQNNDWMKKYYSDEAWDNVERRGRRWTPELQERVSREWSDLFRDVDAALETDPAGPRAQALVGRWMSLVEEFTERDKSVTAGVANLYQYRANWPAGFQQQMKPYGNPKVWEFMRQALACRPTSPENPPSRG